MPGGAGINGGAEVLPQRRPQRGLQARRHTKPVQHGRPGFVVPNGQDLSKRARLRGEPRPRRVGLVRRRPGSGSGEHSGGAGLFSDIELRPGPGQRSIRAVPFAPSDGDAGGIDDPLDGAGALGLQARQGLPSPPCPGYGLAQQRCYRLGAGLGGGRAFGGLGRGGLAGRVEPGGGGRGVVQQALGLGGQARIGIGGVLLHLRGVG